MAKETDNKSKLLHEVWEYVRIVLVVVVAVLLINNFLLINARIPSESMENTIMVGDQIFGNRLAYKRADPERYDIIIFRYPDDESQLFIKRIIGLPGDTINIVDGKVYLEGQDEPLEDSFIPEAMEGSFGPYTVPEDSYFVLGDNRNHSMDSRFWQNTFVTREEILGKAELRYFPFHKIGFVR
ncbi:MAG TPA: signal peptidase I [Lachnospiraceae bacterium]|nr:signal peptidase I [Lachnospiraceae bacterium]